MYLVIDIGSNTIRAVVFRAEAGRLIPVLNKKYSAGLANYISKDGQMSQEGIDICIDALSEIKILINAFSFDGVYPFATASLRNITNTDEVLDIIKKECGMDVKVLSGKQEAFFDYYGSVQECAANHGILADIGGGSTEIVLYSQGEPLLTESLHIGSLNMYTRFVSGIVPSKAEIKEMQEEIKKYFDTLSINQDMKEADEIRGVGGTARAALKLYNSIYHIDKSNTVYEKCFLKKVLAARWEEKEMTRYILKTAPERIHTLIPGLVILYTAAEYFNVKKIVTGSHGVREGYLYYTLKKEGLLHA